VAETIEKSVDHRRRGRWLRRGAMYLVAAAVVAALVYAWLPKPLPADLVAVSRGALRVTVDEDGRARVKDRYVVSAPVGGGLARVELHAGDPVGEGMVVARVMPAAAPLLDERSRASAEQHLGQAQAAQKQSRAQIQRAEATASYARSEASRLRELNRSAVAPQAELERALMAERSGDAELASTRFAARVADHEVEMARIALRQASGKATGEPVAITSPVGGHVLRVLRESEGVVAPGTPLLEVGDPAALEIVVDVLTSDAVRVRPGGLAIIDAWGGPALEGRVRRVEPSAFTRLSALGVEEQRVNALVDIVSPRPRWEDLGDGYRVEVHVVVWERPDAVKAPASAVFRHGDGWALFRVDGGVARLTPVGVGERTGREVQITGGIAEGAQVIVYPSDRIADGTRVVQR
jgi:HlyD family secretion protein